MTKVFLLFSVLIYISLDTFSFGQSKVYSVGELPVRFSVGRDSLYNIFNRKLLNETNASFNSVEISDFLDGSVSHYIENIQTGKIIYGVEANLYIKSVANLIIQQIPELKNEEINFYIIRDPSVNASSYYHGEIHLNVGLLCQVNSEAELAFIIAHELVHYIKKHTLGSLINHHEITRFKQNKKSLLIKHKSLEYSRKNEIEADSIGFDLLLKAGYPAFSATKALERLKLSDQSYYQGDISLEYLFDKEYLIPSVYKNYKVSEINRSKFYLDKYHSHPNTDSRINLLVSRFKSSEELNSEFIVSELKFRKVQQEMRLEQLNLFLLVGNYSEVIYNSLALQKYYPEKADFIQDKLIKAIYGLAKFKMHDKLGEIISPSNRTPGNKQVFVNLFRQLTKTQLISLSLKYIHSSSKELPEHQLYKDIIDDLTLDLQSLLKGKASKLTSSLPKRAFMESLKTDGSKLTREEKFKLQKKLENFYQYNFDNNLLSLVNKLKQKNRTLNKVKVFIYPLFYEGVSQSNILNDILSTQNEDSILLDMFFLNSTFKVSRNTNEYNKQLERMNWLFELNRVGGLFQPLTAPCPINKEEKYDYRIQLIVISEIPYSSNKLKIKHLLYDVSESLAASQIIYELEGKKIKLNKFYSKNRRKILNNVK